MDVAMETSMAEWNISEEVRMRYVAQVQGETTKIMIPVMTLLVVLCVLGVAGNSLVLVVYYKGFKKGGTRVLILFIAALDLFSCLFAIPGEVYDMFHLWDWSSAPLCKARMLITGTSTVASALALLLVSVVRYRKVCFPFGWQVGSRHARLAAIFVLVLSVLASVPLAVVNGRQTKPLPASFTADLHNELSHQIHDGVLVNETDETGAALNETSTNSSTAMVVQVPVPTAHNNSETITLYGHECTTDDAYVGTTMPTIATGILLLVFIGSAIPLCTMYGLIGHKAWRHRKQFQVQRIGTSTGGGSSDGVGLRVFRMLSAKQRKPSASPSSGDTTGSSTTNTTSCSGDTTGSSNTNGASSFSSGKGEPTKAEVSTISTGELARFIDRDQCSSTEEKISDQPAASTRKQSTQHGIATDNPIKDSLGNSSNRKISRPQAEGQLSSKSASALNQEDAKAQAAIANEGTSNAGQTQIPATSGKDNFVEINLNAAVAARVATGDSSSEDLSDTNEGQGRRFAKTNTPRKSSHSSMFKTLIKRSESETTFGGQKTTKSNSNPKSKSKSSWHLKFRRRSSQKEKKGGRTEVVSRTTVMLFTISTIYIVGYVSHLSMIFFKIGAPSTFNSLGFAGLALWNFFLRLYFVNCAANPVVYSLCDLNFRRNCLTLFKRK
ncbi:hypothetical protein EGW08_000453 [Elysia chlorotica]|uniref:G-protein coupled receptors family 1 profile domain-containing protein n=1 Tax=Elysia chlorotica TaxID=188477 RepID=A0A433UD32_ELYCH|nr:hypothetical protein EGW08_000453 [Elysia chlorotica]